ncbi:hypothetical protein ACP70R_018100 [Stipagrostis hirtigluma subsp. patula]
MEKSIPRWKSLWMLKMLYQSTEPGYLLAVLGIDPSEIQRNVLFSQQATVVMVFTSLRGSPQPKKLELIARSFCYVASPNLIYSNLTTVIPCSTM